MKTMIVVLSPEECCNLLNGDSSVLVRKKFPSDYVGWFYIYCAKDNNSLLHKNCADIWWIEDKDFQKKNKRLGIKQQAIYNGKVIAGAWCDKVEDFEFCEFSKHKDNLELYNECVRKDNELCKKACISCVQMVQYLDTKAIGKDMFGKAIHITKLDPFDKPKKLALHTHDISAIFYTKKWDRKSKCWRIGALTHAPRNGYCYVEV